MMISKQDDVSSVLDNVIDEPKHFVFYFLALFFVVFAGEESLASPPRKPHIESRSNHSTSISDNKQK